MTRMISEIAREISREWKPVNYAARPYLDAMHSLGGPNDMYGFDSARSIVLYFLGNASQFRGDAARRLKAELKSIVEAK